MNVAGSLEIDRRHMRTKWWLLTVCLCLLSMLAGRYTVRPEAPPGRDGREVEAMDKIGAEDIETVEPYGPIITRSEGNYTPELIRRASHILNGYTLKIGPPGRERGSKKLFRVSVMGGMGGTFLERDGSYVQVDSGSELIAINEILIEHKFTRHDFDNPQSVDSFLREIIWLHSGTPGLTPCSSHAFERMRPPEDWLRGTEKDEAVLRELCEDPEFAFDGDVWTVVFNVIRSDGAVDRWRVVGEHDPLTNTNEIWAIRSISFKPPRTFSYPLYG